MNHRKLFALVSFLTLTLAAAPLLAATIEFRGDAALTVSVTSEQASSYLGAYNAAEIGQYLGYPHESKSPLAVNAGAAAAVAGAGMAAANTYTAATFNTQGTLKAEVPGFISQYNENRMDVYFDLAGGVYTFTIQVAWNRTYGWDERSGGNPLTETGWYSNIYAKLVQEGTIFRQDNLVLVSQVQTVFPPPQYDVITLGGAATLKFVDVELPAGSYTLYLADYMTQYGVDPPQTPLPGSLGLFVSGLLPVIGWKLRNLV